MFAKATVFVETFERRCSERPPIRGIDQLIAEDKTDIRRLDPPTEQCDPPIKM